MLTRPTINVGDLRPWLVRSPVFGRALAVAFLVAAPLLYVIAVILVIHQEAADIQHEVKSTLVDLYRVAFGKWVGR